VRLHQYQSSATGRKRPRCEAPRLGAQPRLRSLQQTANANGSLGTARSCGCRAPRLHPGTPNNNCIFSLAERLRRAKHPKSNRSKVTPIPKVQAEQQLHTFMSERLRRATHPDSHRSRATPTPKVQAEQHIARVMGQTIARRTTDNSHRSKVTPTPKVHAEQQLHGSLAERLCRATDRPHRSQCLAST
jgi:hypothetical protein